MMKNFIILLFLFLISNNYATCPVMVIDLIRHGDRTRDDKKLLLPSGMQREYQLGKKLRTDYIEQCQLLPEHYQYNTMLVKSSDLQRTLMSAQSFLLGFYPLGSGPKLATGEFALPKGFQPIPIHTLPLSQDNVIRGTYNTRGIELLKEVSNYFQNKTSLRFVLYSGHNGAIHGVMRQLGVPLKEKEIPYASDLSFQLFSDNTIKIYFNDEEVLLPGCKKVTCNLDQFISLVTKLDQQNLA